MVMGPYRHQLFPVYPQMYQGLAPLFRELKEKNLLKWIVLNVQNPDVDDALLMLDKPDVFVAATVDREEGELSTAYILHNFTGRRAQFHFIGRPCYFGKRMRQAGREGLDQVFLRYNIDTLWSEVPVTNRLIIKLATDVGFQVKTVLTNAFSLFNTENGKINIVDGVILQMNKDEIRW